MPGVIEDINDRLNRLEREVSELRVVPTDPDNVWADGGMTLADAAAFSGVSRSELYELMNTGELPWSKPSRNRIVPRRWLVRHLEKNEMVGARR